MNSEEILRILDVQAERFTFPMLDNGYFYLAATRLSLFRSEADWAIVIEMFNYNPRAFRPSTDLYVFASRLHNRDACRHYEKESDHQSYLKQNPHNEFVSVYPIEDGPWMDSEEPELLASSGPVRLREEVLAFPDKDEYSRHGIDLQEDRPHVFEFCRYLAAIRRERVLATPEERRSVIPAELDQILQLEEWHHPDLLNNEKPSQTEAFQQLAQVLETGHVSLYAPTESPNTHWSNWPHGGTL